MTHIDPDAPRATKPTNLEERAWLLARTATRLELARRVIALAGDIERLYERLAGPQQRCSTCDDGHYADSDDDGMGYGPCPDCGRRGR